MQSGSFWAFREAAEIPDRDHDAPDVRVLWDKSHVARRPHICALCDQEIPVGVKYRSLGQVVDGDFETMKMHGGGYGAYPSACPRFAERDRAEIAAQFETDRQQFFPAESNANSPSEASAGKDST